MNAEEECHDIVQPGENLSLGGIYATSSGKHPFIAIIPESRYDSEPPPKPPKLISTPAPEPKPAQNVYETIQHLLARLWRETRAKPMGGVTPYACRHGSMPGEICPDCDR
jgi:hypothetical protein